MLETAAGFGLYLYISQKLDHNPLLLHGQDDSPSLLDLTLWAISVKTARRRQLITVQLLCP